MKIINSFICITVLLFSSTVWSEGENTESGANNGNAEAEDVKERKYVTDKLRLSLYKKADSNSGTLKLLISGDVLEVLDRSGPYSKVRTDAGLVGWVKNGFLVTVPTASFLLIEEEKKTQKLTKQLEKYSNTQKIVDDYENTIMKMNKDNENIQQENEKRQQQLEKLKSENNELKEEIKAYTENNNYLSWKDMLSLLLQYWYVVAITLLLLFIAGFVIGREMIQSQIRKRFQGVKVL